MLSLWICLDIGVVRASDVWSVTPSSPSHTVTFLLHGSLVTKAPLGDVDSPPVGRGYFFPQSLQLDYSVLLLDQYYHSCHLQMPLSAILSRMRSDVIWQSSETRGNFRGDICRHVTTPSNLICTPYLKLKIMKKKRFVSNVICINGRIIDTVFYLNLFNTTMDLSYTIYINNRIIELKIPYC